MPDADLLAAVTEEIGLDPEDPKDVEVGALAARAAGRVLAERLRAEGEAAQVEYDGWNEYHETCSRKAEFDAAAERVARWCGAEPEGDGNGD